MKKNMIVINPLDEMPAAKPVTTAKALSKQDEKSNRTTVVRFTEVQIRQLAMSFNLDFDLPKDVRIDRAVQHMNQSARYMLAAGIDFLGLKEECEHGEFLSMLESRGIEERSARRAMQYTEFLLSRTEAEREQLLDLPKSHVLAIASADPEVIDDLLHTPDQELKDLSVRELRNTIKDLSSRKTDMAVQLETADQKIAHLEKIIKDLREARVKTGGNVPVVVQDIRLECAALHKKAALSLDDMEHLIIGLHSGELSVGAIWHDPTLRHVFASITALHAHTGSMIAALQEHFGDASGGEVTVMDVFSDEEVLRCAQEYKQLIAEHEHEKKAREWDREMERPRGKGRPSKRPELEV
ncbi:hypothetical protein [Collimonas antrihumi]|uniref:hypothetical protein n=1 Tax=Collimonas antrihumi TaxID=1940615 RepID=UPI001B8D2983|nr:hypothetical protein [Collimonas antrihumi]